MAMHELGLCGFAAQPQKSSGVAKPLPNPTGYKSSKLVKTRECGLGRRGVVLEGLDIALAPLGRPALVG